MPKTLLQLPGVTEREVKFEEKPSASLSFFGCDVLLKHSLHAQHRNAGYYWLYSQDEKNVNNTPYLSTDVSLSIMIKDISLSVKWAFRTTVYISSSCLESWEKRQVQSQESWASWACSILPVYLISLNLQIILTTSSQFSKFGQIIWLKLMSATFFGVVNKHRCITLNVAQYLRENHVPFIALRTLICVKQQ